MATPRLSADDREQFEAALASLRRGSSSTETPPWVIAEPLLGNDPALRDDPDLAASMHALQIDSRGRAWLISGYLRSTEYGLALHCIALEPFDMPGVDVTALADRLQLGRIRRKAILGLRSKAANRDVLARAIADSAPTETEARQLEQLRRQVSRRAKPSRRGRTGFQDDYWRALALEYLELRDSGTKDIPGEIAARRGIGTDTIRTQLRKRCVERGFLLSRGRGRPYELGPNLYPKGER